MTSEFTTHRLANGTRLQAGIPTRPALQTLQQANGLLLRGVVTATYVSDSEGHPALNDPDAGVPTAVYCDVLCYSYRSNQRWSFLPRVLVSQDQGSMHGGKIWKPRATTMDISGVTLDVTVGANIGNLDGDHVLVGFMDDNLALPVILRGIPHPQFDLANDAQDVGHRMKLELADGDPDFWKHKGVFYGVTNAGDFVVDTTMSYAEDLTAEGHEPDPPEDGTSGNYQVKLQKGAVVHIQIEDGETLKVELKGGDAQLTLGDGAKHVAIAEALKSLYNSLKQKLDTYDTHVHPTGMGPSGPPNPMCQCPAWESAIESSTLALPEKHA
jgi:hypothetical protein